MVSGASGSSALAGRLPQCLQQLSAVSWERTRDSTAVNERDRDRGRRWRPAAPRWRRSCCGRAAAPRLLADERDGASAQDAAGAAHGFLQVQERGFNQPLLMPVK